MEEELKVSQMTEASSVTENDYVMIIQNGANKKVLASKVGAKVIDNLDSSSSENALSAKKGKMLNEKIENANTYSTQEVDTGKKWINGKPIYRIVFTGTKSTRTMQAVTNDIITALSIDEIIEFRPNIKDSDGRRQISYYYGNNPNEDFFNCWIEPNGKINIRAGSSYPIPPYNYNIILEYTKTTD